MENKRIIFESDEEALTIKKVWSDWVMRQCPPCTNRVCDSCYVDVMRTNGYLRSSVIKGEEGRIRIFKSAETYLEIISLGLQELSLKLESIKNERRND